MIFRPPPLKFKNEKRLGTFSYFSTFLNIRKLEFEFLIVSENECQNVVLEVLCGFISLGEHWELHFQSVQNSCKFNKQYGQKNVHYNYSSRLHNI